MPPFDLYFSQATGPPTTTTADVALNDYDVNVVSVAGISVGTWLGFFSGEADDKRYMWAEVLAVNALMLTLDRPMDFA